MWPRWARLGRRWTRASWPQGGGAGAGSVLPWYAQNTDLANSVVARWKLDEASGSRADSKGTTTLSDNATVTSNTGLIYPLAAEFTAANSEYLNATSNAAVKAGDFDWWLSAWFYASAFGTNRAIVTEWTNNFMLYTATNTLLRFALGNGGSGTVASPSTNGLQTGWWNHVVAWHDDTANTAYIQLNGGLLGSAFLSAPPGATTRELRIGSDFTSGLYWDGRISNVAMGKLHLPTAAERLILFQEGISLLSGLNRDVFIIAGQSNASGRGTNNQTYSHATLKALMYDNRYALVELRDPVDLATSQIDAVSADTTPAAGGSVWPLVATSYMAATSRAPIFVPCAMGGTSITAWLPGADHFDRTTLYGSMVYRIQQAAQYGNLRLAPWWQGETDAVNGMSQAAYRSNLNTLADALRADTGIKLMPCKIQDCAGSTAAAGQAAINAAIGDVWSNNSNVEVGADLSSITTDSADKLHLNSDAKLASAAALISNAINAVRLAQGW